MSVSTQEIERWGMTPLNDYIGEEMTTAQILGAWWKISDCILCLRVAIGERLIALGYDPDNYEDGDDEDIDRLVALQDNLEAIEI